MPPRSPHLPSEKGWSKNRPRPIPDTGRRTASSSTVLTRYFNRFQGSYRSVILPAIPIRISGRIVLSVVSMIVSKYRPLSLFRFLTVTLYPGPFPVSYSFQVTWIWLPFSARTFVILNRYFSSGIMVADPVMSRPTGPRRVIRFGVIPTTFSTWPLISSESRAWFLSLV